MTLQVVFLGTAGSIPTSSRSLPAIALRRKGELILFDCGENVQRQMIIAGLGFDKKMRVFITHMHGDHLFGLPGMIQSMSLLNRRKRLEIYGPSGLKGFIRAIEGTMRFALQFPLEITEVENAGLICEGREYEIFSAWADHVTPTLAYSLVEKQRPGRFYPEKAKALGIPEGVLWSKLQHRSTVKLPNGRIVKPEEVVGQPRPGRKIVYTGDCRPSSSIIEFAKDADLLIHDCTFDDELSARAWEDGHSTPSQAAETSKKARVKRLILTHISARYKTSNLLLKQARNSFSNVDVAEDFMKIDLPLINAN